MHRKKGFYIKFVFSILIVLVSLFIAYSMNIYFEYRDLKLDNTYAREVNEYILEKVKTEDYIKLKEATPFTWDRVYLFAPYAVTDNFYKKVGRKWTSTENFIQYLIDRVDNPLTILNTEGSIKMVFCNNGKVMCDYSYYGHESIYFDINEDTVVNEDLKIKVLKENPDLSDELGTTYYRLLIEK